MTDISKRISNTLAKHGIEEQPSKRNSYLDSYPSSNSYSRDMGTGGKDNGYSYSNGGGDYASNSMSWRRKLNEDSENYVTEKKTVISRATSPQPDSSKQVRRKFRELNRTR